MRLIEITQKEVIKNREKYCQNQTQFLLKIKGSKYYRTAIIVCFEDWDEVCYYCFEYENYDRDCLGEGYFENIYIIEQ